MYKVFYKNKFLLIGDKSTKCNSCLPIKVIDNLFIDNFLNNNFTDNYIYITNNIDKVIEDIKTYVNYIKAAGGLVLNNKNEVLLIKHYNIWDLPKGWIEKNENIRDAALREVSEECGITNIRIDKQLSDTFHIYKYNSKFNLKHTVWFLMKYNGSETLNPQVTEDISEAIWVKTTDIPKYFSNMYNSIKELLYQLHS